MSLRVGYCLFYVAFMIILSFFSLNMGIDIISVQQQDLLNIPVLPPTPGLLELLTFVFELAVFGLSVFGFLISTTSEFLFLTIFLIVPLSAAFLWSLIELVRGN